MAKIDMNGMDELLRHIDDLSERAAKNGQRAVNAGGEMAKRFMQGTVPVNTGGLKNSLKVKPLPYNSVDGYTCDVYPDGKRADGERYAEIGFVNEYGRSNMAPNPWMRTAVEANGGQINEEIGRVLME